MIWSCLHCELPVMNFQTSDTQLPQVRNLVFEFNYRKQTHQRYLLKRAWNALLILVNIYPVKQMSEDSHPSSPCCGMEQTVDACIMNICSVLDLASLDELCILVPRKHSIKYLLNVCNRSLLTRNIFWWSWKGWADWKGAKQVISLWFLLFLTTWNNTKYTSLIQ